MHCTSNARVLLVASLILLTAPLCAQNKQLPDVTEDGLELVPDSKLAIVYAEPGATLAEYNRVQILEPYVAFRKNWERDQRSSSAGSQRITSSDIEKIKSRLAQEFLEIFTQVLEDGGYPVVDAAGEDVLLLRPAIINLDITAPDVPRAGRSRSYVSSAGEMTLYVELYDSVTGDLIAKALDRKADRYNDAFYTWSNSVSNKAAADRILKGWASILLSALNEARDRLPGTGVTAENES
jgi:hypothetical protein